MTSSQSESSLITITGHTSSVWTSSFSINSSYLATCSSDETARVWSLQEPSNCSEVARLTGHAGVVKGCGFSPDSTLLASCSWDKSILLHRTSDFEVCNKLLGHKNKVNSVHFSPCGRFLASCSWDASIGIWDVKTGTLLHWLLGHCSPVSAAVFLPTSEAPLMASCSWDGTVKVWDFTRSSQPQCTLEGHPDAVYGISASPCDKNLLASCGRSGSFILWDIRTQMSSQVLKDNWIELNCVSFSPNGGLILVGDSMGNILTWDMVNLKACQIGKSTPNTLPAHASSVVDVTFSADGSLLASCSTDHTCRVWDHKSISHHSDHSVASLAESLENKLSFSAH